MLKVTGGNESAGMNSLFSRDRYAANKLILFVCQRNVRLGLLSINIIINYLCFQEPGVSFCAIFKFLFSETV